MPDKPLTNRGTSRPRRETGQQKHLIWLAGQEASWRDRRRGDYRGRAAGTTIRRDRIFM
jgi:hypothetical protein